MIGRQTLHVLGMAALALMLHLAAWGQAKPSIPSHGKLSPLFNGKNFTGFDTLLEKQGINSDPNKVFQVEKGVLHISGQEFGGLVTQKEYEKYYLRGRIQVGREDVSASRRAKPGTAAFSTTLRDRSKSGRG